MALPSLEISSPVEFEYLLDLATRRTPGRILAKAATLQVGSKWIEGFPQAVDAHYLALAANVAPKLVDQVMATRALLDAHDVETNALRAQIAALQDQLAVAQRDSVTAQNALQEARGVIRKLKRQVQQRVRKKVEHIVREVVRYRVVNVPASWLAPDGHVYEIVQLPDALEVTLAAGRVADTT